MIALLFENYLREGPKLQIDNVLGYTFTTFTRWLHVFLSMLFHDYLMNYSPCKLPKAVTELIKQDYLWNMVVLGSLLLLDYMHLLEVQ